MSFVMFNQKLNLKKKLRKTLKIFQNLSNYVSLSKNYTLYLPTKNREVTERNSIHINFEMSI